MNSPHTSYPINRRRECVLSLLLTVVLLLLSVATAMAQGERAYSDTLTGQELSRRITNAGAGDFILKNTLVTGYVTVDKSASLRSLVIDSCRFTDSLVLYGQTFQGAFIITNSVFEKTFRTSRCNFSGDLRIVHCQFQDTVRFRYCNFAGRSLIASNRFRQSLDFWDDEFNGRTDIQRNRFQGKEVCLSSSKVGNTVVLDYNDYGPHTALWIFSSFLSAPLSIRSYGDTTCHPPEHVKLTYSVYTGNLITDWSFMKDYKTSNPKVPADSLEYVHREYAILQQNFQRLGQLNDADDCYFEYKEIERRSEDSPIMKLFDTFNYFSCGYGVRPLWTFRFAFFLVLFFALVYFFIPNSLGDLEEEIFESRYWGMSVAELHSCCERYGLDHENSENKEDMIRWLLQARIHPRKIKNKAPSPRTAWIRRIFFRSSRRSTFAPDVDIHRDETLRRQLLHKFAISVYFSLDTFVTLGHSDTYPKTTFTRMTAMLEGICGWLCLGLFITTYANQLLR